MSDVIVRVGETENASIGIDEQGTIKGENGVTFYPNVNEYGVISWTNDGNRQNPQPVNITGPQGTQGLPAISGVVQFGFDLPTPASNYDGQNWLVQDDFTRLMVLYRSENGEWVDIGSIRGANGTPGINGEDGFSPAVWVLPIEGGHEVIVTDETGSTTFNVMDGVKGENGVTFYPNVNEYGVLSWTNDGEKENPQPRNIAGKDGSGIQIFGTYNELPNAFNHPEIASAIVCTGAPEPYYLYENTGVGWFGRGSLKGDKGDRGDMPFWFGTRAEYNALQTLDPDVCYCIEEGT